MGAFVPQPTDLEEAARHELESKFNGSCLASNTIIDTSNNKTAQAQAQWYLSCV
jgi:hypothetical protein